MECKGFLTINRVNRAKGPEFIQVQLEDDTSRVTFLNLHCSLENFSKAITGLGYVDCHFEIRVKDIDKI